MWEEGGHRSPDGGEAVENGPYCYFRAIESWGRAGVERSCLMRWHFRSANPKNATGRRFNWEQEGDNTARTVRLSV